MMGDDAYSCRAPGSEIERGVRVGLRILITRIVSAEVLPGSGPGGLSNVSVWRLLVLA
jgi:hypothetical protein